MIASEILKQEKIFNVYDVVKWLNERFETTKDLKYKQISYELSLELAHTIKNNKQLLNN